jgi:hypothetical protein
MPVAKNTSEMTSSGFARDTVRATAGKTAHAPSRDDEAEEGSEEASGESEQEGDYSGDDCEDGEDDESCEDEEDEYEDDGFIEKDEVMDELVTGMILDHDDDEEFSSEEEEEEEKEGAVKVQDGGKGETKAKKKSKEVVIEGDHILRTDEEIADAIRARKREREIIGAGGVDNLLASQFKKYLTKAEIAKLGWGHVQDRELFGELKFSTPAPKPAVKKPRTAAVKETSSSASEKRKREDDEDIPLQAPKVAKKQ